MKPKLMTAAVILASFASFCDGPLAQAAGNAAAGQQTFAICRACHQIGPGAKNAIGPELNGVVGRKAGSVKGYSYSTAMKNSGITWNKATLEVFLKNPTTKVPGTKMPSPGLSSKQDIDNVIAFLAQYDAAGKKIN